MSPFVLPPRVGLLACALAALLAGCSDSKPTIRATGEAARNAKAATQAAAATRKPSAFMVSAVSVGKPGAPVSLKFELGGKPAVGEPVELRVELTADNPGITSVRLAFDGGADLEVRAGGELVATAPVAGEPVEHTVVVAPRREGIFYLSAVAQTEGAGSLARSFSIPLVVGDATALKAEKPALPPPDASGERVTSLAAEESGSRP